MKVTSVPESRVVLTLTRSAPAPIIASPCFPRLTPVLESTPCAASVDGGVEALEVAAVRATVGVKEVDPAVGRSKTVLHVCLAASSLTPWSRSQHTVRRCECRCHRLPVTPHPGCRLRVRQATCYRARPAHHSGREKGSREKL